MAKLTPPNLPGPRGGSSTMGIGEPPSSEPSEFVFYYHNDHLGTPLAMTDKDAIVKYSATYYPFGGLLSENVVHSNELRFPGQYHDRETNLHYNWHRHYDPDLGRYLQPDPIGLSGGMNLYGYASQNPLSYIDPMGLESWDEFWLDYSTYTDLVFPQQRLIQGLGEFVSNNIPENFSKGTILGTGFGEEAVDYWAQQYNQQTGACYSSGEKSFNLLMGSLASLWTEENWKSTVLTLIGAYGVRNAHSFWYMRGDLSKAYTPIDYNKVFRIEWHNIGKGAMNKQRWHIDALGGIKHWPWKL